MAEFQWFVRYKWWWIPRAWQGWAVYCIYTLYLLQAASRIAAEYPSWFYRVNWFLQEWLAVTLILWAVCWLTGLKQDMRKKRGGRR